MLLSELKSYGTLHKDGRCTAASLPITGQISRTVQMLLFLSDQLRYCPLLAVDARLEVACTALRCAIDA